MYDPSMRVLTVLELLQARERVTGKELAGYLEVSDRTVQRYIMRLQDLGVPVESTRGPGGAYRLKPGFRIPPLMFDADEALAVSVGLDALASVGLGTIAPAAERAKSKLDRVLPLSLRERVNAVRAAVVLERPARTVDADSSVLTGLALAAFECRCVRIGYRRADGKATVRTIEPYGLMQHDGRWFAGAYCHLRRGPRLFRVDRIASIEQTNEYFRQPDGFDMKEFVYRSMAYASDTWKVEVWLDLPLEVATRRFSPAFAELREEGSGTVLKRGSDDLEYMAIELLDAHCQVEIRRPAELRDAFRRVANRALSIADENEKTAVAD
jgi:predicted DNA-binding transcriptional regulator YafY